MDEALTDIHDVGLEMDIRDLKFDNESFDAVIDKGESKHDRLL